MKMDSISIAMNMESIAVFGPKHGSHKLFLPFPKTMFSDSKFSSFPLKSVPSKPPKYVRLKATASTLTCDSQHSPRKFKKLLPSLWTDKFDSVSINVLEMDALRQEIDVLKPKVKNKLLSSQGTDSTKNKILMIYVLASLGLAYHFEDEINEILDEGFKKIEELMDGEDDLYTISIMFWVFRRYRYNISSDVFKRFKGSNGNFKESLIGDVKGMMSLYEAAHLGTTKCYILDEALSFTSTHLESFAACGKCPSHLSVRIQNSLIFPQHLNVEVLFSTEYILFYEQEKEHDEMLLKFAKINFRLLQLHYLQDLKILTKWYKDLELMTKLPPFMRDRIVECYFFAVALFYKHELSRARIIMTQLILTLVILDDTCDRYASLAEAESLSNSFLRWSPDHNLDKHPEYLKLVFHSIFNIFKEFGTELGPEGKSYDVNATIEEFKELAKAYFDLEKMAHATRLPSFDEYMEVGEVEIGIYITWAGMFMFMELPDVVEVYEWLKSRPKVMKYLSTKSRLMNDLTGFEDDMKRGYATNAVNCYMNQYGVTEEEAYKELNKMVTEADKIVNEEFLTTVGVQRCILESIIDTLRVVTVTYKVDEGFTDPNGKLQDYMTSLFVTQIPL